MRLLLTVTDAGEVPVALRGGADLVDVKDPSRGSLGPPDRAVLSDVARRLGGRAPLGVPLGDGPHPPGRLAARVEDALRADASYLKVGLLERPADVEGSEARSSRRRPRAARDAVDVLASACRALRGAGRSATLMAVTFADVPADAAPTPEEAVEAASAAGADGVMLDTLGKSGGSVLDRLGRRRLGRWIRAGRSEGLLTALAGGLSADELERLEGLDPDVVGVRGAACVGGRAGRLDPARCRALRRAVDRAPSPGGRGATRRG